jgi:serine/threonine protein kinase
MIVMEYAAHGDLRRYLQDPETLINWKYIICLSRWITESLCKIHERGFMHKDFHTGNILIDHTRRPLIADM